MIALKVNLFLVKSIGIFDAKYIWPGEANDKQLQISSL